MLLASFRESRVRNSPLGGKANRLRIAVVVRGEVVASALKSGHASLPVKRSFDVVAAFAAGANFDLLAGFALLVHGPNFLSCTYRTRT
jgi:uncharacterized protein YjlB